MRDLPDWPTRRLIRDLNVAFAWVDAEDILGHLADDSTAMEAATSWEPGVKSRRSIVPSSRWRVIFREIAMATASGVKVDGAFKEAVG